MFKSAWDAALPVYAIGTALIFVFGSLLKTDERRSSVTLWGRSAQSQTPNKLHLPGKSRWRRTPFASVPIGTVYFDGQPNRSSSLIRCHDSFWAGSRLSTFGHRLINSYRIRSAIFEPDVHSHLVKCPQKSDLKLGSGCLRNKWCG